jgi:hypothetical protein
MIVIAVNGPGPAARGRWRKNWRHISAFSPSVTEDFRRGGEGDCGSTSPHDVMACKCGPSSWVLHNLRGFEKKSLPGLMRKYRRHLDGPQSRAMTRGARNPNATSLPLAREIKRERSGHPARARTRVKRPLSITHYKTVDEFICRYANNFIAVCTETIPPRTTFRKKVTIGSFIQAIPPGIHEQIPIA